LAGRLVEAGQPEIELHDVDAIGTESGVEFPRLLEGSRQQQCTDHEQHRHRELGDDERLPGADPSWRRGRIRADG
jgi:hypothetical protein